MSEMLNNALKSYVITEKKPLYIALTGGEVFKYDGRGYYKDDGYAWKYELRWEESKYNPILLCSQNEEEVRITAVKQVLLEFMQFRVQDKPTNFNKDNEFYTGEEHKCAFFTEGFLYALLGKEDARSVLIRVSKLLAASGLPPRR